MWGGKLLSSSSPPPRALSCARAHLRGDARGARVELGGAGPRRRVPPRREVALQRALVARAARDRLARQAVHVVLVHEQRALVRERAGRVGAVGVEGGGVAARALRDLREREPRGGVGTRRRGPRPFCASLPVPAAAQWARRSSTGSSTGRTARRRTCRRRGRAGGARGQARARAARRRGPSRARASLRGSGSGAATTSAAAQAPHGWQSPHRCSTESPAPRLGRGTGTRRGTGKSARSCSGETCAWVCVHTRVGRHGCGLCGLTKGTEAAPWSRRARRGRRPPWRRRRSRGRRRGACRAAG